MYGTSIRIAGPFTAAIEKVTAALKQEGFGDGQVGVGFLDAQMMVQLTANPAIAGVADEASQRLGRVREALASAA